MVLTTESVWNALQQFDQRDGYPGRSLGRLVQLANRELREWGHDGHQVTVERITPYFGDSQVLRCSFWCETCHVSHHALINMPLSSTKPNDGGANNPADGDPRPRRAIQPSTPGMKQRILG
ncbi:MAG: hypothetical protein F4038_06620 [Chloroflexi bacterium]|nr:hypothetical protein [Chloroflexota bacterium]